MTTATKRRIPSGYTQAWIERDGEQIDVVGYARAGWTEDVHALDPSVTLTPAEERYAAMAVSEVYADKMHAAWEDEQERRGDAMREDDRW